MERTCGFETPRFRRPTRYFFEVCLDFDMPQRVLLHPKVLSELCCLCLRGQPALRDGARLVRKALEPTADLEGGGAWGQAAVERSAAAELLLSGATGGPRCEGIGSRHQDGTLLDVVFTVTGGHLLALTTAGGLCHLKRWLRGGPRGLGGVRRRGDHGRGAFGRVDASREACGWCNRWPSRWTRRPFGASCERFRAP